MAIKLCGGRKGFLRGNFNQPGGVAVDSDDNVYVSDTSGYSTRMIQQFSPNGTFVNGFGTFGNGPQYFAGPSGMAIDSRDDIFVADFGNPKLRNKGV